MQYRCSIYGYFAVDGHVKTAYRQVGREQTSRSVDGKHVSEKIREKIPEFTKQRLVGMINHDCFLTAKNQ